MPDGDIIHPTLSVPYISAYRAVCSPDVNPEYDAHGTAKSHKKCVQGIGDAPIEFIREVDRRYLQALPQDVSERHNVDFPRLGRDLERLAREYGDNPRGIDL